MKSFLLLCVLCFFVAISSAQPIWQAKLDSKVQFYQTTDFGVLLVGTDNSLYAVDGNTGDVVWRRKHKGLDETSISTVPNTDLVLLSLDEGDKSRLEAIDLFSGDSLWRSDKVKGDVMHLAVEPNNDLLCVVLVKKAKGKSDVELKRKPQIYVFSLSNGKQLWKKEIDSEVDMMPTEFAENKEVSFTLDNYRAPLMLDGKLYVFYEGATIFDSRTGKEIEREKFKVNEDGLALTEADPVFDEQNIYLSGRGRVRAINRQTGKTVWKADDLGVTPEMFLLDNVLYVRTGGQFTKIKNGETEEKGSFGISAIETNKGKTLWRFKGADKGLTNFVFADANTIFIADKDDLMQLDARNGKRLNKIEHKIKQAQFVIQNEKGELIIGGKDEVVAFEVGKANDGVQKGLSLDIKGKSYSFDFMPPYKEVWRTKHKPPSRGIFKIVGAIALRATALYFRYGGLANSVYGLGTRAMNLRSTLSLRSNLLQNRFGSFDLTSLATNYAKSQISNQIRLYGVASRARNFNGLQVDRPNLMSRVTPSRADVQERLFDRLDPTRQLDRLSDFLLKRKELAELRGNFMYFYTDLDKPFDKKGLVGVNVHNGQDSRFILVSEPDSRFITDEVNGLLYSADGNRLQAFDFLER
ncbi:MAG: PQQ-binding-like beta-propeller repeat protein [Pyrinomonadaceae bacterium]|nr:PQQ-binding-like beta-propeller repeat protein [Pyrinomonadaceae bacterium]